MFFILSASNFEIFKRNIHPYDTKPVNISLPLVLESIVRKHSSKTDRSDQNRINGHVVKREIHLVGFRVTDAFARWDVQLNPFKASSCAKSTNIGSLCHHDESVDLREDGATARKKWDKIVSDISRFGDLIDDLRVVVAYIEIFYKLQTPNHFFKVYLRSLRVQLVERGKLIDGTVRKYHSKKYYNNDNNNNNNCTYLILLNIMFIINNYLIRYKKIKFYTRVVIYFNVWYTNM